MANTNCPHADIGGFLEAEMRKSLGATSINEMAAQEPLTATKVRDTQYMLQTQMADAFKYSLGSIDAPKGIEPGRVQVKNPETAMSHKGPSVQSNVVAREPIHVPAPSEAFAVQVAVTAELDKAGCCTPKMVKQITDVVMLKRHQEGMEEKDLLEVFVGYSDVGVTVKVTADAKLSKALVEVVDHDKVTASERVFRGEMTYEQFEAHQDAVSGAEGR